MHAMFALYACVFTVQCRLDTAMLLYSSVLLFTKIMLQSSFQPHPQEAWSYSDFELHENCKCRSSLVGTVLFNQDKACLQRAPLHSLKHSYIEDWLDALLYDGISIPATSWRIYPQQSTDQHVLPAEDNTYWDFLHCPCGLWTWTSLSFVELNVGDLYCFQKILCTISYGNMLAGPSKHVLLRDLLLAVCK